ncbi:efflux RND transporter permease subunit [Natrinema halophilum]|uniref:efflux RND transporter permease subunit n=1 Tax=Natrinema halophilum TaxID=1699371 RepID=UPI001F2312F0|nr:MMPL family transporter [Natrinema halophilum]UHQ96364.1 MMPL family transporter [Natrinema halophilum]
MNDALRRIYRFITEHNLIVLALLLVLTAGIGAGTTQLQVGDGSDASDTGGDTRVAQKMEYVQDSYGDENGSTGADTSQVAVYVRTEDTALSKRALLDSLRFQRTARENESVAAALGDREVLGVANLIAKRVAGDPDARIDEQIAALEAASEPEVERHVRQTLIEGSSAMALLPEDYEPGTATAESHRMVFPLADDDTRSAATTALYEIASKRDGPEYFTTGEHASDARTDEYLQNTMMLIVPAALLMILLVLAFSYRDLVDVLVGFTGVILSVVWMFGILGWLRIPAGISLIVGPVLIVGLSVDYGLHVFMRYREQRGDGAIREPMVRGLSSVTTALGLVTLTAMVGFMSNVTNDVTSIRQLAYAISLGVLSTFVISLTLVPALKVTIDRFLERFGLDRQNQPLGKTGRIKPLLSSGASLAKRGAPVVIVFALVVGSAGAVAWTDLDRQSVQHGDSDVAEWKQNLPGPLAWEVSEESKQRTYVNDHYRAADEDARSRSSVLIEGDVTSSAALESVQTAHDSAADSAVVYRQGGTVPVTSPLTVMAEVAAEDEAFAETLAAADTDGDGVPDQNVEAVYDALYTAAPDRTSRVIDRDDGEYHSVRVVVPVESDITIADRADGMRTIATAADGVDGMSAVAVGSGTLREAKLSQTADSILQTLIVALVAVGVLLTVVYRLLIGSASLGAVTAVPIVLVSALVIGGMWLFAVPLTVLTALLLSLVIGIGIDYNIHISDRFARERDRGRSVQAALVEATTGTGGALLGSTLTSAGAFSALLLHPHPQLRNFGTLVVLAMTASFIVAVFVLPSMLSVWAHYGPSLPNDPDTPPEPSVPGDD